MKRSSDLLIIASYISSWKHGIIPFMEAKEADVRLSSAPSLLAPAIIMAQFVHRNVKRYVV